MPNPMQPFLSVRGNAGYVICLLVLICNMPTCTEGYIRVTDSYTISPTDNAELACKSDALPKPRNYQWFKNGKEIKNEMGKYDFGNNTETLEVISVDELDVGEYTCIDVGTGETANPHLYAGAWSKNGKNIIKTEGNSFTVDCHAWGYPPPEIKWYKDGNELVIDGSHYMLEDRETLQPNIKLIGGRLRINKAKTKDTGKYKCIATNLTGYHEASISVLVQNIMTYVGPALGILALLILLGVGVGLYVYFTNKLMKQEKKRKAKWKKMEAERRKQLGEQQQ